MDKLAKCAFLRVVGGVSICICIYIHTYMAFSINWGPFKTALGLSLGLIYGRFRADPYENYMAVSVNCGSISWMSL